MPVLIPPLPPKAKTRVARTTPIPGRAGQPVTWPKRPVSHKVLPKHPLLQMVECPGKAKWTAHSDARKAHSRRVFENVDELLEAFSDYAHSLEASPTHHTKKKRGDTKTTETSVIHYPPLLGGFCYFLGIDRQAWVEWRTVGHDNYREDLAPVIRNIEEAMRTSQIGMASAKLGDPNVLARVAGLAERRENENTTKLEVGANEDAMKKLRGMFESVIEVAQAKPGAPGDAAIDVTPEPADTTGTSDTTEPGLLESLASAADGENT